LIGLSLIVALWTALWALIAWDYRTETRAGFIQTDTLARAVAEHTERVLWEADQLARNVSLAALERGIDMPLRSYVELGLVQSDVFLQLALIDRDGILRASTERDFLPVDLSDREHVRVHRDGRYDGLFVGKPVIGRASGRPSIQLSRAIRYPDGELLGIVVISVDPRYLTNFYRELREASNFDLLVVGTHDYVVRARHRDDDLLRPAMLPATSPLRHALRESAAGSFARYDPSRDIDDMASFRKLANYPVAVAVSLARDDALAPFRLRRDLLLIGGLLMTAFIVYTESRRWRLVERLAEWARQLDEALKALSLKAGQTETLFTAAPDAVLRISDGGKVEAMNPRMRSLLRLAPDQAPPVDIAEFVARLLEADIDTARDAKQHWFFTYLLDALRNRPHETVSSIINITHSSPRRYEVRLTGLPPPEAGLMLIMRDITSLNLDAAANSDPFLERAT